MGEAFAYAFSQIRCGHFGTPSALGGYGFRHDRVVLHRSVGIRGESPRPDRERSGLGVPIDLVYLNLGGTVVELILRLGCSPQSNPSEYRPNPPIGIAGRNSGGSCWSRGLGIPLGLWYRHNRDGAG
jgi:hypothetical protein